MRGRLGRTFSGRSRRAEYRSGGGEEKPSSIGESGICPNCHYIGPSKNCSCQWTIQQVADGKGNDPKVVANAKAIIDCRDREVAA